MAEAVLMGKRVASSDARGPGARSADGKGAIGTRVILERRDGLAQSRRRVPDAMALRVRPGVAGRQRTVRALSGEGIANLRIELHRRLLRSSQG